MERSLTHLAKRNSMSSAIGTAPYFFFEKLQQNKNTYSLCLPINVGVTHRPCSPTRLHLDYYKGIFIRYQYNVMLELPKFDEESKLEHCTPSSGNFRTSTPLVFKRKPFQQNTVVDLSRSTSCGYLRAEWSHVTHPPSFGHRESFERHCRVPHL